MKPITDWTGPLWADADGEFVLSDGSHGNPGCDSCGEEDAVVFSCGRYLCAAGAEEQGLSAPFGRLIEWNDRGMEPEKLFCVLGLLYQQRVSPWHGLSDLPLPKVGRITRITRLVRWRLRELLYVLLHGIPDDDWED